MIIAFIINHSKYVESRASIDWNEDIFPWELPAIRHISICTNMRLVSEIKINFPCFVLIYKLLQLFAFICVYLRRGITLWAFSYTSKSCAKADKKLLKVLRQAFFPVAFCQISFALLTLKRSFSMAAITIFSSEASMIGFRPCPDLFRNPSNPSTRYLFTQRFTVGSEIESFWATSIEDKPSDFIKTIWLRFRKEAREPNIAIYSNSTFCSLVSVTFVICMINVKAKIVPDMDNIF